MSISKSGILAVGLAGVAIAWAGCAGDGVGVGSPIRASLAAPQARSGNESVIYAFTGANDGGNAATELALDPSGNLYGTAVIGGSSNCGVVFKLSPKGSASWKESVIGSFDCYDTGKSPHGGVTIDPSGALTGTTVAGGSGGICASDGCGVAYQFSGSNETILHAFTAGNDGFGPGGRMVFDAAGNAYGTTPDGGKRSAGTIYELSGTGSPRTERILHAFTGGNDGSTGSMGALLVDTSGTLYGVTELGGKYGAGTVFSLVPSTKKLTTIYAFRGGANGGSPYGGLVSDASGNLYGTTYYGGNGNGTLYELVRKGHGYSQRVLYAFGGNADGAMPTATLVAAHNGRFYGTTSAGGGECNCGTIFSFDPKSGKERVEHSFAGGNDGAYAYYGMTQAPDGTLYGATVAGGRFNQGAVFALKP